MSATIRNYQIDNLKGILIFLVVFGHFLQPMDSWVSKCLYLVIYTFHMPLFAYTSGYYAKFDRTKIVDRFLYPYLIWQVLYLGFSTLLNEGEPFTFLTPYYHLWYLPAMAVWTSASIFLQNKKPIILIPALFLIAILAGFIDQIGLFLSLGRIICFFPFFVMGQYRVCDRASEKLKTHKSFFLCLCIIVLFLNIIFLSLYAWNIPDNWMHHTYSYDKRGSTPLFRSMLLILSMIWILFLGISITRKSLPIVRRIGQNTMPVFLLHAFLTKFAGYKGWFWEGSISHLLLSTLLSGAVCVVLGNRITSAVLVPLTNGKWIKNIASSLKNKILFSF